MEIRTMEGWWTQNVADVMVILAADDPNDLEKITADKRSQCFPPGWNLRSVSGCVRTALRGTPRPADTSTSVSKTASPNLRHAVVLLTWPILPVCQVIDPHDPRSAALRNLDSPRLGRSVRARLSTAGFAQRAESLPATVSTPPWAKNGSYVSCEGSTKTFLSLEIPLRS